jgi:NAD(P)-dependent dehydrogenase (short-subunit alcohol dehydrogenase family)
MADASTFPKPFPFTKKWHTEPYPSISPERPELSVAGKNVIVTGGGTGIGNAIATAFAKAGAKTLTIIGRRVDRLETGVASIRAAALDSKTSVSYEAADLTSAVDVEKALDNIVSKGGKIDIVVSNAGTLPDPGLIVGYDAQTLMRGFELNTMTVFNVLQAFVPRAGADPVFVNITTNTAHMRPIAGIGAYTVSKAAGLKLVEQFSFENPGFHVVQLHPGTIPTAMNGNLEGAPDVGK